MLHAQNHAIKSHRIRTQHDTTDINILGDMMKPESQRWSFDSDATNVEVTHPVRPRPAWQ